MDQLQLTSSREQLRRSIARTEQTLAASRDGSVTHDDYLAFQKVRLARERAACAAFRAGLPIDEIASEMAVEPIAVYRILQRYATTEGLGSP
ncbi:MAG: hypothetical protein ACSLFD_02320 [Solirubrobacterales bacterium]